MVAAVLVALITGIALTKRYSSSGSTVSTEADATTTENLLERLTPRELQILKLIHHGKTNKEIAAMNFVELTTVKTHVNNLYAKLEVNNRKAAAKTYGLYAFPIKSSFSPPPENA
jgi:DNA-binding NarL/FixJ family response regulator